MIALPALAPRAYARHCRAVAALTRAAYWSLPLIRDPLDVMWVFQVGGLQVVVEGWQVCRPNHPPVARAGGCRLAGCWRSPRGEGRRGEAWQDGGCQQGRGMHALRLLGARLLRTPVGAGTQPPTAPHLRAAQSTAPSPRLFGLIVDVFTLALGGPAWGTLSSWPPPPRAAHQAACSRPSPPDPCRWCRCRRPGVSHAAGPGGGPHTAAPPLGAHRFCRGGAACPGCSSGALCTAPAPPPAANGSLRLPAAAPPPCSGPARRSTCAAAPCCATPSGAGASPGCTAWRAR